MVEMGRHLFHSMVKDYHIEPSPQHYSSMVDMLGHAGKLEEAEELMSQIPGQPGIQKKFPEEFAERKLENDTMTNFGVDLMPLFVMDGVLLFQKFPLPIFEPRYRLMVIIDSSTCSIADFACEVEITKKMQDKVLPCFSPSCWLRLYGLTSISVQLQELTNNAAEYARLWIGRVKEQHIKLASLSNRRPHERLDLLCLRDTRECESMVTVEKNLKEMEIRIREAQG
ncbi:unnamed protein product [Prunus brigantina]